jgi:hypothetical protein
MRQRRLRHGGGPAGVTMNQVVRSLPFGGLKIPPPQNLEQALQYARTGLIAKSDYKATLDKFRPT